MPTRPRVTLGFQPALQHLAQCGYADTMDAGPDAPPGLQYTAVPCTALTEGSFAVLLLANGSTVRLPLCQVHVQVLEGTDVVPIAAS